MEYVGLAQMIKNTSVNHMEKRKREYGMRTFREKGFNLVIKVLVQIAWSAWISVVVITNTLNALRTAGFLPQWVSSSGNFQLILSATAVYHTPAAIDWVLFLGVIVCEAVFALLFWRSAVALWKKGSRNNLSVQMAYVFALPLWLVFLFFDEVFLNYPIEGTHLHIFIGLLVTFLLIQLVPDLDPSA
jgi:predicted small integral membrane protein